MDVDSERLRDDIETNGEFGGLPDGEGNGRTVLTGSEADRNAREYFVERLESAGCEVRVDPVGNIAGRWVPEGVDPGRGAVAAGSHLDSVPRGGIFDGPLGVYGALEALRTIKESDVDPERPIEVVSFTEEEGARFSYGLLGSSVATGGHDPEDALARTDDDGVRLERCLEDIGFRGEDDVDPREWDAWLELHVEQDTRLDRSDVTVGVVESISGITNCRFEVEGEANHAGATPMDERVDALSAASEVVLAVERAAGDEATAVPSTVGTVSVIDADPNTRNVVPEHVDMDSDIRSTDYGAMNRIVERAAETLDRLESERGVETAMERYRDQEPCRMADACVEASLAAAEDESIGAMRMHSAALHDTRNVANVTDAGMLFAPSEDGISHTPEEWTDWKDCAKATAVLAGTIASLAQ